MCFTSLNPLPGWAGEQGPDISAAQPGLQRCLSPVATPWKSTSLTRRLQTAHLRSPPVGIRQIPATAGNEPGLASLASLDPVPSPGTRPLAAPRAEPPPRPSHRALLAPGLSRPGHAGTSPDGNGVRPLSTRHGRSVPRVFPSPRGSTAITPGRVEEVTPISFPSIPIWTDRQINRRGRHLPERSLLCCQPSQPHHPPRRSSRDSRWAVPVGTRVQTRDSKPERGKGRRMEKRSPQRSPTRRCLIPSAIPRLARTALGLDPGAKAERNPGDALERPEAPLVTGGVKPGADARTTGAARGAAAECARRARGTEPPQHFAFSGPVHESGFRINQS